MSSGEATDTTPRVTMEEITALAKRRGFIFQSSEIYGGIGGFFDYGPLGAILKRNVKRRLVARDRRAARRRRGVRFVDHHAPADVGCVGPRRRPFTTSWSTASNCKHRFRADHLASLEQVPRLRHDAAR